MSPQPGKVKTQVSTMSLAIAQLTDLTFSAAPAPMMAAVLVWVVETGRPVSVAMSRETVAETEDLLAADRGAQGHAARAEDLDPEGEAAHVRGAQALREGHG